MAKNIVRAEKTEDFEILDLMPRRKTTDNGERVGFDLDFDFDIDSDSDFDFVSNSDHDPDLDSDTDSVWDLESGSYSVIRMPSTINASYESLKQATKEECVKTIGEECTLNKTFLSQEQIHHPCHQKCCPTFFSSLSLDSRRADEPFSAEWCEQPIKTKKTESEASNQSYSSNEICLALKKSFKNEDFSLQKECKTVKRTRCNSVSHEIDCSLNEVPKSVLELADPVKWNRCLGCQSEIKLKCQVGNDFCHNCALERALIYSSLGNSNCNGVLQVIGREDEEQVQARVIKDDWYGLSQLESCFHCDWRWCKGRHQCQVCFQHQTQYIFECILCCLHVCYRCRRKKF